MPKAFNRSGFFLFECMIVIAFIIIITALSVGFSNYNTRAQVRAELEKLHALILYAQHKAIIENGVIMLAINTSEHSYELIDQNGNKQKHKLGQGALFGFIEGAKGPPWRPKKDLNDPVTFKDHVLFFYPDGTMNAGAIYITNQEKSVLYALSSSASALVYIRLYRFIRKNTGSKWDLLTARA